MNGKSVGVTVGTTPENYLKAYLAANGMSMDDIKPVNLAVPDMATALSQGTVDAVVPWEPQVSEILRTQEDVKTVVRGGPYGRSVVGVMVTDQYFKDHADIIEKYVVGAWQGDQFTREHPEEAAVMAQRYISNLNLEDVNVRDRANDLRLRPADLPVHQGVRHARAASAHRRRQPGCAEAPCLRPTSCRWTSSTS